MDEVELIWRNAVLGQAPNSLLMPPGLLECLHYLAFQPPRSTACIRMPTGSLVRTTRARHERPRAIARYREPYRDLSSPCTSLHGSCEGLRCWLLTWARTVGSCWVCYGHLWSAAIQSPWLSVAVCGSRTTVDRERQRPLPGNALKTMGSDLSQIS